MSKQIDIDNLRTWIGKQDHGSDVITDELLRRFRATLGEYTLLTEQLPLGIHWCLAQPAVSPSGLGLDGHPAKGGFLPPVPLPRRMWASSQLRFHQAPCLNVAIDRTSTISDVVLKNSAASGPLVFVHIDHDYAQGTEALIQERQTIVYREATTFKPPKGQKPRQSTQALKVLADTTLLFRYSALTFNSHRIHYDQSYATGEEGYPGLVVQGPMMATLLMNLAQTNQTNSPLREFEFKGVAPAFVDYALHLAVNDEACQSLEIRNHEGAVIMNAKAQFGTRNEQ